MSASEGNSADSHEPKTPMWLPALGAVLFLTAGLVWGLSSPSSENTSNSAATAPSAAADAGAPGKPH